MKKLILSIGIGVIAGVVDIIPMLIQRLEWTANLSAFVHWIVLGIIINYINFGLKPWLQGMIVGLLTSIPVMILTLESDSSAVIPILVMSVLLGALVGFLGNKYANNNA